MINDNDLLYLGVDYGTTRVKATLLNNMEEIIGTYTIAWNKAGCNKLFLSDWLSILKIVIRKLFRQTGVDSSLLKAMAITTMSPCLILSDPQSNLATSPIILYDEVISLNNTFSRDEHINSVLKILSDFTPNSSGGKKLLLTANSWLVWQLTGKVAIDNYSLYDVLGNLEHNFKQNLELPRKVLSPSKVVGNIKFEWAKSLGLSPYLTVSIGGTDTVALARATKIKKGEHLIYLGTFFSVLEAKADFDIKIPYKFNQLPYQWHISLEGGALIERLATSFFPLERNRNTQIKKYLNIVRNNLLKHSKQVPRIITKTWTLGIPVHMLPRVSTNSIDERKLEELSLIPFVSFVEAVKEYFSTRKDIGLIPIIGGLSSYEWITKFISDNAKINCSSKFNIFGAEGAALLAKDSTNES